MSSPTAAVLRLMAEAAELRAGGASWETVGRAMRRRVEICQRWPELYPSLWARLLAEAGRQLRENAAGEAITILRGLLRSEEGDIRRDAAKVLLAVAPDTPPPQPGDLDTFVQDLDEADAQQLRDTIDAAGD